MGDGDRPVDLLLRLALKIGSMEEETKIAREERDKAVRDRDEIVAIHKDCHPIMKGMESELEELRDIAARLEVKVMELEKSR